MPHKYRLFMGIACILLLTGVCMLLYPVFSQMQNDRKNSQANAVYTEQTNTLTKQEKKTQLKKAKAFNKKLQKEKNPWALSDLMKSEYYDTLDISDTGVMGNVIIPKIGVNLPIYHGNADNVLSVAVGHMEGSSFPTGEKGTHAVISGHTGMASANLFTHLDELKKGDTFFITVLGEQMVYEITKIHVVLPDEMDYLAIDKDESKVTLLTCTPHGVNSHRLLVTGKRRAKEDVAEVFDASISYKRKRFVLFGMLGLGMMNVGAIALFIDYKNYKDRRKNI